MKRKGKPGVAAPARPCAQASVPGRQIAVALMLLLAELEGRVGTGEAAKRLGAARSSFHRILRILARQRLVDLSVRGSIALGSAAAALGSAPG